MKEFDKESERQNYRIRKGDKIWLWNIHYKGLGLGKYIGSKRYTIFGIRMSIPIFKIKNKIIKGFECWWVPKKEADNIGNPICKDNLRCFELQLQKRNDRGVVISSQ